MGQGGHLILINNTGYDWERISVHSYQMEAWDNNFPPIIKNGETRDIYIEWSDAIFKNTRDDKAHTTYKIAGTAFQFAVRACRDGSSGYASSGTSNIWIDFKKNIGNMNVDRCNKNDGGENLGWVHNGRMGLNLCKDNNGFYLR